MAYVLEVISKDGKIKYINSAKATVYCPEYAARYDDKKTAMTVAAALLRNECYRSISVKKLSLELCVASYKRNRSLSFNLIYPNIYKQLQIKRLFYLRFQQEKLTPLKIMNVCIYVQTFP